MVYFIMCIRICESMELLFLRFRMFYVRMEYRQKQILFIFALLIGGILLFALRLKAPPMYGNIKPNPSSSLLNVSNEHIQMRKRAIRALFISRSSLSFCKHTSNTKFEGNDT